MIKYSRNFKINPRLLMLLTAFLIQVNVSNISCQADKVEDALFWEVSGNGLETPSYIFGTIHIMPKKEFQKFRSADEKLEKCEKLVLEINIDVPLKTQIEWAKKMILPSGSTLKDYMTESEFEKLKSFSIDSLGLSEKNFNTYIKFKPFAFFSALIPKIIDEKIEGYDKYFLKKAKKEDLIIDELESFEFQMGIFDSIKYEDQMEMFFEDFRDPEKDFNELIKLYKEQKINAMAKMYDSGTEYEQFEYDLIIRRNYDWVPKIRSFIHESPTFVAVGAGHLGGNTGIIKLLMEEGYQLKPISLE